MLFTKTKALSPILIKGKTRPAGYQICPAECLISTQQELQRGKISPLEDFLSDGNVWSTEPEEVATLFEGVNFEFVQEWAAILYKMEKEHPKYPAKAATEDKAATPPGRPGMLTAIRQEALRRRDINYHNNKG